MRVGLITREYPPEVYGGAGVHVEYLSRELAKLIEVEVHCWGTQRSDEGNLHVIGDEPPAEVTAGTTEKFKTAVDALALNLTQMKELGAIDVVHTHTWYASMAGFLAKKLYKDSVCADDAQPGAAARVEGRATGFRLRDELVDGADGDSGCGRDYRGVAWDQGGHSARVSRR